MLFGVGAFSTAVCAATSPVRQLECEATFPRDTSVSSLIERYGANRVSNAEIYVGEGKTETATVLFEPILDEMIYFLWKDSRNQRTPRVIRIDGPSSHWRTAYGVKLGMDLKSLEWINGRPFVLMGFGWEYSGTVVSWSGGFLETAFSQCKIVVRLTSGDNRPNPIWSGWYKQVMGEREFPSDHPAMQYLNPFIRSIALHYY